MADEQNPNTDTTTTPTAPATQSGTPAPSLTQADVDAAVKRATDAAWAEARRTFEGKQKPTGGQPPPTPPAAAPPQAPDVSSEYARHRAFDRTIGKFELSEKAQELVEREFASSKTPDPIAWLNERAEAYGWKRLGATPAPAPAGQPATPPPAVLSGPPVTSRGTPPPAAAPTDDTPILSMSHADREALRVKIGDVAFADRHLKELVARNTKVRPRLV